jgi:hypothetical protein
VRIKLVRNIASERTSLTTSFQRTFEIYNPHGLISDKLFEHSYLSATHDFILCGAEAKKHGMPGASAELFSLVAAIYDLESIADTNREARLLKNVGPTAPDRPVRIQIQVLPPPGRVSPPQSCSRTVYGEGPVKTISFECF